MFDPDRLADACPSCDPGIPDASLAIGPPRQVPGGIETDHECSLCPKAWTALWRDGWVIYRMYADVAEDQRSATRREAA